MAKNASLNPASVPFFPGLKQGDGEDGRSGLTFGRHGLDQTSVSSTSASSFSEYRSAKSSPSPSQYAPDAPRERSPPVLQTSRSPTNRQADAVRPYSMLEPRREGSVVGVMGTLPEDEDVSNFSNLEPKHSVLTSRGSFQSLKQDVHEQSASPPVATKNGVHVGWGVSSLNSASPVSSIDSLSQSTVNTDSQSFESQLKASPFMADLLERLVRCEASTRQIQSDLTIVHRKVNILVDRALAQAQAPPPLPHSQPEFVDPFSRRPSVISGPNGHQGLIPPQAGLNHRASMGNIAPNQLPPDNDVSQIRDQLNTLTSSVGQLIALQAATLPLDHHRKSTPGLNTPVEIPPHQVLPPVVTNQGYLGHGRPDLRPSPRQPNPPMRTWSAGNLELPVRNSEPNTSRPGSVALPKRGSVASLMRRDSAVCLSLARALYRLTCLF
jgi:hypothetical protein